MKIVDALQILRRPLPDGTSRLELELVCGFTPLHLHTFLAAELRQAWPLRRVEVSVGVFDDLIGNVQRARQSSADAVAVIVEWSDIDARLGLRRLGGWGLDDVSDIVEHAELYLTHLSQELARTAESKPVVCSLPTLPLPPVFPQRPEASSAHELRLREHVASLATQLSGHEGIRVCSGQILDEMSPLPSRRDLRAEFATGFPYSLAHASAIAHTLAVLIRNPAPKKGLITDLDGTLWAGILGEVGVPNVSWNLDSHSQRHALYQQFLASLASAGVLIGVASKNDPSLVAKAFERTDLLLPKEAIFPFEAHWGAKSASVQRILDAWNISPHAVVIVDDSPIEIAEVHAVYPDVAGILFPENDADLWPFFQQIRALFGKNRTTSEDALRLASLRSASELRKSEGGATYSSDDFLTRIEGSVTFAADDIHKPRVFELLNKTNQFNLNGMRLTEVELNEAISDPRTALVTASYEDRYGPLGTIAALLVRPNGRAVTVDAWAMSCRAFSRRIEHHCLNYLFEKFGIDEIAAAYRATERNGPLQEFLTSLLGEPPSGAVRLTRDSFRERSPLLVHRVKEAAQ